MNITAILRLSETVDGNKNDSFRLINDYANVYEKDELYVIKYDKNQIAHMGPFAITLPTGVVLQEYPAKIESKITRNLKIFNVSHAFLSNITKTPSGVPYLLVFNPLELVMDRYYILATNELVTISASRLGSTTIRSILVVRELQRHRQSGRNTEYDTLKHKCDDISKHVDVEGKYAQVESVPNVIPISTVYTRGEMSVEYRLVPQSNNGYEIVVPDIFNGFNAVNTGIILYGKIEIMVDGKLVDISDALLTRKSITEAVIKASPELLDTEFTVTAIKAEKIGRV